MPIDSTTQPSGIGGGGMSDAGRMSRIDPVEPGAGGACVVAGATVVGATVLVAGRVTGGSVLVVVLLGVVLVVVLVIVLDVELDGTLVVLLGAATAVVVLVPDGTTIVVVEAASGAGSAVEPAVEHAAIANPPSTATGRRHISRVCHRRPFGITRSDPGPAE